MLGLFFGRAWVFPDIQDGAVGFDFDSNTLWRWRDRSWGKSSG